MPINSHVQIPSSIQRGFSIKGKNKETFVYELEANLVDNKAIKKKGAIFAYFNNEAEESLDRVETDFGEVKKKIRNCFKNKNLYFLKILIYFILCVCMLYLRVCLYDRSGLET